MESVAAMMVPGAFIWICAPQLKIAAQGEWPYIQQCIFDSNLWPQMIQPKIRDMLIARGEYKKKDSPDEEQEQMMLKITQRKYMRFRDGNSKEITIRWPGAPDSKIQTVSYNNRRDWIKLEGAKVTLLIFAEGSRVPLEVWERHLRKRLSDTSGRVIIPCTPKGRDQFLYPTYLRGLSNTLDVQIDYHNCKVTHSYIPCEKDVHHVSITNSYMNSFETFHHPAFDNPYYNMDDYKTDEADLFAGKLDEATFLERCFGCFVSFAGSYYHGLDWEACTADSTELKVPATATHYVTIDPGRAGRASAHWIAVCEPDASGTSKWIVYDEMYEKGMWVEKIVERILEKNNHPIVRYICDRADSRHTHHGEHSVQENMKQLGLSPMSYPWKMPGKTIDHLNYWRPRLQKGELVILKDKCPCLIAEMEELEYSRPRVVEGKTVNQEVLEGEMHALDDITYAVYCNLRWRDYEEEEKAREAEKSKVEPGSVNWVIHKRMNEDKRKNSLIGVIGTW